MSNKTINDLLVEADDLVKQKKTDHIYKEKYLLKSELLKRLGIIISTDDIIYNDLKETPDIINQVPYCYDPQEFNNVAFYPLENIYFTIAEYRKRRIRTGETLLKATSFAGNDIICDYITDATDIKDFINRIKHRKELNERKELQKETEITPTRKFKWYAKLLFGLNPFKKYEY